MQDRRDLGGRKVGRASKCPDSRAKAERLATVGASPCEIPRRVEPSDRFALRLDPRHGRTQCKANTGVMRNEPSSQASRKVFPQGGDAASNGPGWPRRAEAYARRSGPSGPQRHETESWRAVEP